MTASATPVGHTAPWAGARFRPTFGALNNDGNGGSRFLHERALADPDAFFRLRHGAGSAAGRLSSLRLRADADAAALTNNVVRVLADLRPPSAFYVRLLATDHPDFPEVERFFRDVVDAVAAERGRTPREMGREQPEWAFINVEIFEALHRAGVVVVDLTGVRPNCMMELGYAPDAVCGMPAMLVLHLALS
jgi:hypothetical protein